MNLWLIFLTGLTTGGVSCAALQSGLLLSALSQQSPSPRGRMLSVVMFLGVKLAAYTFLGFFLGALGSALSLSLTARLVMQGLTAVYMFATAMNLLDVHPVFRYVVITPPKSLFKRIKQTSKSRHLFAPALLGLFTVLIPCGVTQAMEVLAINSGSAVSGAAIMAGFVLGTMPLFSLIGLAVIKGSQVFKTRFTQIAAVLLMAMALYTVNGILTVMDAPFSWQKVAGMYQRLRQYESGANPEPVLGKTDEAVQKVAIEIKPGGYQPRYLKVSRGVPVELTVITNGVYSCANAFTLRAFNIFKQLAPTDKQVFTFTPQRPGRYTYSCSMGMYTGTLEVI